MSERPVISLKKVNKKFNQKQVIKDLSFEVQKGELIALLGCNGAGKTTTINMLLGLEQADSGEIAILSKKPGDLSVKQQIGVTPQGTDFPEGLKVSDILKFVAAHYTDSLSVEEAVQQFSLQEISDQLTSGLSYGQKRRVAVALAFIGKPKLVFLDEPTTGLDVNSRRALWDIMKKYQKDGGTLVLTTHYLEEAEQLASRVLVLADGAIRSQGTVDEIIAATGMSSVSFIADSCTHDFKHSAGMKKIDNKYIIETSDTDALIRELVASDVQFSHLFVHKNSLETAFLEMNASSSKTGEGQ